MNDAQSGTIQTGTKVQIEAIIGRPNPAVARASVVGLNRTRLLETIGPKMPIEELKTHPDISRLVGFFDKGDEQNSKVYCWLIFEP